jgi:aryl-alcohol dehydrogenase-like predicted oxidoreductase
MESLWKADSLGSVRYETIQNNYSLLNRRFEDELAAACRRHDVGLLPYSPIGAGVLSGKYQGGNWPAGARFTVYKDHGPRTAAMTKRFVSEKTLAATERLQSVAEQAGLSLPTFAVAWTLSRDYVGSTIIGATSVAQVEELLLAAEASLSAESLAACDAISREIPYPMG